MKLLLDIYIWLWSLLEPRNLTRRVAGALHNPRNELWLSSISTWEVLILSERSRIVLAESPRAWIDKALQAAPLREAPLTHEIVLETFGLKFPHRDPADRFLVATARVLGLTLVTADERLINSHQVVSSSKFISHRTGVRAQKFPPNPPRTYSDSHAVGYSSVVASDEAACFRVCLKIRSSAPLEDFRHFSWSRTSIPTMPTSF
jgi:PIN domain nuclease of toxin-antitoxin system